MRNRTLRLVVLLFALCCLASSQQVVPAKSSLSGAAPTAASSSGASVPRTMPQAPQVPGLSPAAERAMQTIDPEKIRAHVRFLSHDLLEGRGTGARGGDIAAQYIATEFALIGLEPSGDNGSYLQRVPMVALTTLP